MIRFGNCSSSIENTPQIEERLFCVLYTNERSLSSGISYLLPIIAITYIEFIGTLTGATTT
jgi:hypothetical protein